MNNRLIQLPEPIRIYFTRNNCREFFRYVNSDSNYVTNNDCKLFMNSIYNFGTNITYDGLMYIGIAMDKPINTAMDFEEAEWVMFTKHENTAKEYLERSNMPYKYLVVIKGTAIDPAVIKAYASLMFDDCENLLFSNIQITNGVLIAPFRRRDIILIKRVG